MMNIQNEQHRPCRLSCVCGVVRVLSFLFRRRGYSTQTTVLFLRGGNNATASDETRTNLVYSSSFSFSLAFALAFFFFSFSLLLALFFQTSFSFSFLTYCTEKEPQNVITAVAQSAMASDRRKIERSIESHVVFDS